MKFGWKRSLSSELRGKVVFGGGHPHGQPAPNRRQRSWSWREARVFAVSLRVEQQPREVHLPHAWRAHCTQREGASPPQKPCPLRGEKPEEQNERGLCGSLSPHPMWSLVPVRRGCQESPSQLGKFYIIPRDFLQSKHIHKKDRIKIMICLEWEPLWTYFQNSMEGTTLGPPRTAASVLALAFALYPYSQSPPHLSFKGDCPMHHAHDFFPDTHSWRGNPEATAVGPTVGPGGVALLQSRELVQLFRGIFFSMESALGLLNQDSQILQLRNC